jgi:hypothetical protein
LRDDECMVRDEQPDGVARTDREKSSPLEAPSISVSGQRTKRGILVRRTIADGFDISSDQALEKG